MQEKKKFEAKDVKVAYMPSVETSVETPPSKENLIFEFQTTDGLVEIRLVEGMCKRFDQIYRVQVQTRLK